MAAIGDLFAGLMGRIYSRLSRVSGWRPVGKYVRISVGDSADAAMVGQALIGVITEVAHVRTSLDTNVTDECPVIQLDSIVSYSGHRLDAVLAAPRYIGYGLYSLPFTGTAFYIVPIDRSGVPEIFRMQDVIAISWISLCRFRKREVA